MKFFSSFTCVKCPDGPRYILKKPEKAFAIAAPGWDTRIKAIAKFIEKAEAEIEVGAKKELKSIVKDLSENYAALQAHYQAAYLTFAANPCSKEAERACQRANKMILKKEFSLRRLEVETEELSNQMIAEKKMIKSRIVTRSTGRSEGVTKTPLMAIKSEIPISQSVKDLKTAVSKLRE